MTRWWYKSWLPPLTHDRQRLNVPRTELRVFAVWEHNLPAFPWTPSTQLECTKLYGTPLLSSLSAIPGWSSWPSPPPTTLEDLSDTEKAKVIRRHLVSRDERVYSNSAGDPASRPGTSLGSVAPAVSSSAPRHDSKICPIPCDVPGGVITHRIYK